MASISIEKSLAIDLINTKLYTIVSKINSILERWNYDDSNKFISDVKKGIIEEAEDDAISFRNLLDTRENLLKLKNQWV